MDDAVYSHRITFDSDTRKIPHVDVTKQSNAVSSVEQADDFDLLNTPIVLSSHSEDDQVQELHEAYMMRFRLLFDYYGVPFEAESDPASQLRSLVIEMAKTNHGGFRLRGKKPGPKPKFAGALSFKLYAFIRNAVRETEWSIEKVIQSVCDPAARSKWSCLDCPEYHSYMPERLAREYERARSTVRKHFKEHEKQDTLGRYKTFEEFEVYLIHQFIHDPERFSAFDVEAAYLQKVAFTRLYELTDFVEGDDLESRR